MYTMKKKFSATTWIAGLAAGAAAMALSPAALEAQQTEPGRFHVAITAGQMDYDMAVVGKSSIYSARAGARLSPYLGFEAHLGYTGVEDPDGTTHLYTPEAQLQAHLPLRWISPYVGAGAGMIVADSYDPAIATDSDVTFTAAGGATAALGRRMLLLGEVRLRGVGSRFTGATGDLNVGVGYRF